MVSGKGKSDKSNIHTVAEKVSLIRVTFIFYKSSLHMVAKKASLIRVTLSFKGCLLTAGN
jgi:hypothetical protein